MLLKSQRKELQAELDMVGRVFPKGSDQYYQAVLVLMLKLLPDHLDEVKTILATIPRRYYLEGMPQQMESDVLFARTACQIAETLAEAGVAPGPVFVLEQGHYIQQQAEA